MPTYEGLVVVLGANGGTGREVVARLAHHGVATRAVARSERKLADIVKPGTETAVADVRDVESLENALRGARAVINCIGTRVGFANTGKGVADFFGFGEDGADAVDNRGTVNVLNAMKRVGAEHLVIVTSMLINQPLNPFSLMMKPFGDILTMKDKAEKAVRASGLRYTIVRPGGLTNQPPFQKGIKVAPADALSSGSISRADVAEVCAQALWTPAAYGKTLEIVADDTAPVSDWGAFFASVPPDAIPAQATAAGV
ncbi:MAG: SDR family oxidoreductase [Chloracidobacterium sp.]|uniref:SDR family oxidoreductase n=1 Tax=Chloracidobacterium validum TaxID=2821543 RepID=A0ABX8B563_9BACT|nr:SDR family oxidoreductase [Chloracidobacterium validum]QUW02109.1 SDR family oxidoreductase [Chloracidobacterium validum]